MSLHLSTGNSQDWIASVTVLVGVEFMQFTFAIFLKFQNSGYTTNPKCSRLSQRLGRHQKLLCSCRILHLAECDLCPLQTWFTRSVQLVRSLRCYAAATATVSRRCCICSRKLLWVALIHAVSSFSGLMLSMASPGSSVRMRNKTTWNFLSHKMTRNNTSNKVRVAATELPQLLSQNTNMFGEPAAQSRCQTLCRSKVNWKH